MELTGDDLDGYDDATVYEDGTVVRVSVRRTDDDAYPSGWRYTFHYGALTAGPENVEFPGIEELYERFWDEIPKPRFDPSETTDES
jgi:hypothetical protein